MADLIDGALIDADDVKEIIDTDLTGARIHNFINFAVIVSSVLANKLGACGGSTALGQIQLLLAAHFLTLYERTTKSESVAGEWSVTYAMQEGLGLNASLYGQQAIALDCSGTLSKSPAKRATIAITSYPQIHESTYLFDEDML